MAPRGAQLLPERCHTEMLLEREPELERMREAIRHAATGPGGLVVIGGPAGIGKTALARAGAAMADAAGMQVLRARASDLEQEFAFGVVRQLFEGPLARVDSGERAALLRGAAALAGPLFQPGPAGSTRTSGGAPPPDPAEGAAGATAAPADRRFTMVHSLYWLTANISSRGPVALVVDDCHWADAPSLRFLAYVSARSEELGTLLILTVRDGEPSHAQELLAALHANPHAALIEPTSLSEAAVATLVRSGLGQHAEPEFCAACARASAGNPFLVRELIAELKTERVEPVSASVPLVETVRLESVSRAVVARLNRLGADSRNLARSVAVLESASLRQAATLAGLAGGRAMRAADRLISAQILAPSASLTFVHPLLQRAVYERIPAAALADGHRRAGLLLAAQGARSTRVGAHLMRGEPAGDPAVVTLLREAAREALTDGAPHTAVRLLRRALGEPPGGELRGVVLGELGEAEALARNPAAEEHLREALTLVADPALQVRLASALSELLVWDGRVMEAHAAVERVAEQLGPGAPTPIRAVLETIRATAALVDQRLAAEIEPRLPALRELAAAAGPAGRGLLVFEACWKAGRGPHQGDWRKLLDAGLDRGRLVAEEICGPQMARHATVTLVLTDEVERAREQIAAVLADTVSRGSINAHLSGLTWGALLALRQGDLRQAEAEARSALELAQRHEVAWARVWLAAFLGEALLERGAITPADDVLARSPANPAGATAAEIRLRFVHGRVRLEQARTSEAIETFQAVGESLRIDNPNYLPWRSTLALVLVPTDPSGARELADEELRRARWFGQPRGIGVALRACGLLEGGSAGIALLSEAATILRPAPARLELARTLYSLGAAQRRSGQRSAAREPLREALGLAQKCSADQLAARIQEELAATGVHLRRDRLSGPESLTPAERRVAELAAGGLTNREIARALFVTVKTVGTHLGHIYDKLDLQGPEARERLAEVLPGGEVLPGTEVVSSTEVLPGTEVLSSAGSDGRPVVVNGDAGGHDRADGHDPPGVNGHTAPRRDGSRPRATRTLDGAQRGYRR
jgi:DNA-binding CsgD family transcriptional regulator